MACLSHNRTICEKVYTICEKVKHAINKSDDFFAFSVKDMRKLLDVIEQNIRSLLSSKTGSNYNNFVLEFEFDREVVVICIGSSGATADLFLPKNIPSDPVEWKKGGWDSWQKRYMKRHPDRRYQKRK